MNLLGLIRKILHYLDLESEVDDFDKIHETISKEIVFKGTNLWILMFAIIVASVGLNMNSTAVVIGAMLISPLMGPINGMGYSIANYNFFQQGLAFDAFDDRINEVETLKGEINRLQLMLLDKEMRIDSLLTGKQKGKQILGEIKSMYPEIVAASYEQTLIFRAGVEQGEAMSIVVFTANAPPDAEDKSRIENWLKARLNTELVRVFYDVPGGRADENF